MGPSLKSLRTAVGLSQQEVADRLEISRHGYNQMESGKRPFPSRLIESIAAVYNVEVSVIRNLDLKFGGPDRDPDSVGGKIYAARNEAGLTIDQLADKLNVNGMSVSRWERTGVVRLPMLQELAAALNKELAYFLTGDDPVLDLIVKEYNALPPANREKAGSVILGVIATFSEID